MQLLKNKIKKFVCEAFEVLNDRNRQYNLDTIENLYVKLLFQFKKNKKDINKDIRASQEWRSGMRLFAHVEHNTFASNDKPLYNGYFYDKTKSIVITMNYATFLNFDTFRSVFLHEMTHYYDNDRKSVDWSHDSAYFLINNYVSTDGILGDIIYRLWSPTERNAYTTKVTEQSPEIYKNYIETLSKQINTLDDFQYDDNEKTEKLWKLIGKNLFPNKIKPNTPWQSIKNYFVNSSRVLLNKFERKCKQRYAYYKNNNNFQSNMKDLNFRANNFKDYNEAIKCAASCAFDKVPVEEFYNKLIEKNIKLSKKRAIEVYLKTIKSTYNNYFKLLGNDKDYNHFFDWMRNIMDRYNVDY